VVSSFLTEQQKKMKNRSLMIVMLCLYVGYMVAILQLSRVMYLYHYFLPLLFSYILFGLSFMSIERIGSLVLTASRKTVILTILSILIFAGYQYYRPLSYYEFIGDKEFEYRSILPIWELSCVNCKKVNSLAIPPSQNSGQ
jgi:dolichyl-phosphate-mannose--protein O-mannosyl transferase